ncbi:helix-turn-helix domain-containing protein [Rhodospira trueperi]
MLDERRSITEIALEGGYSSHGHFTGAFRKATGTTPTRFRRDLL